MKTAARREFEVQTEVAGPPVVRIVDATLDQRGFEYEMTRQLERDMRAAGISVGRVEYPKTPEAFFAALGGEASFNTLLLVAHGEVAGTGVWATLRSWFRKLTGREVALRVQVSGMVCPWQLLGEANANLTDKMVFLAVCGGHCPDSTWAWVTEQQNALLLVASRRSVSRDEVLAVFPKVLEDLKASLRVTPEALDAAVKQHNVDSAFEIFSGVGVARDV